MIKMCGARAVLAKSFARIFYRNCTNNGFPAVVCDTDRIEEGDALEVDFRGGIAHNKTTGTEIRFAPLPPAMEAIMREGGLVELVRKHVDFAIDLPVR